MATREASHYPELGIGWGRDGRAVWAKRDPAHAIVFVHGFNGNTKTTFKEFPTLLAADDRSAEYDIFLFGYNSLRITAGPAADQLLEFLDALGTDPKMRVMDTAVPPSWRRPRPFNYSRLLIVAHSLGAIVTRLALLRADRRNPKPAWLPTTEFALYAPAHLGATVEELIRESFLGPFMSLFKSGIPVLNTLRKNSPLIEELQRDSLKVLNAGGASNHVRARKVIHSQTDNVVEVDARFCNDPDPAYVEEFRTHSTVCKASAPTAQPFLHLRELL